MNVLDTILQHTKGEVARRKRDTPPAKLMDMPLYHRERRSFSAAIRGASPAIIAELKKASPSKGEIRSDFDVPSLALGYERGGACALSVLTDERFFSGSLRNLALAREAVSLPLLRKDFLVDAYQLHEALAYGADAVLLIIAALDPQQLTDLMAEATAVGLETLVEVHTEREMESALEAGVTLLGINNRDLQTFNVDIDTTVRMLPRVPPAVSVVSESGIQSANEIQRLQAAGVHGFLLGESLMRTEDPGATLARLIATVRGWPA